LLTKPSGHWEEVVVSYVKQFIPDSVKQTWHDWRGSMKKAEHAITGSEDVNDHIDQVEQQVKTNENKLAEGTTTATTADAWGVEEARKKNRRDASKSCLLPHNNFCNEGDFTKIKLMQSRSGYTTGTGLRNSQILHLHSSSSYCSCHSQGC
jgi:hypothetical protein